MRRGLAAAVGLVVGVAAGGCGASSAGNGEAAKPAATVLADAKAAMGRLTSFHAKGSETSGTSQVSLDVTLGTTGGGGTVGLDGVTLEIVQAGGDVYLRGDAATWSKLSGNAQAGPLLADRWLQTTTSDQAFGELANLTTISAFVGQLTSGTGLKKGATTTFDGHPAVPLTDSSGTTGTIYVAATGAAHLLGANGAGSGTASGSLTFDQFDSAKLPAAPQGAVSLAQIEGGPKP